MERFKKYSFGWWWSTLRSINPVILACISWTDKVPIFITRSVLALLQKEAIKEGSMKNFGGWLLKHKTTCGVRAAPALGQAQGAAPPGWGRLRVGEARRRAGRGRVAAPGALGDLPQLMGQRGLAVRNGAWRPSRFHLWQFTWMEKSEGKVGLQNQVTERQLLPQEGILQSKIIGLKSSFIFAQRTTLPMPHTHTRRKELH